MDNENKRGSVFLVAILVFSIFATISFATASSDVLGSATEDTITMDIHVTEPNTYVDAPEFLSVPENATKLTVSADTTDIQIDIYLYDPSGEHTGATYPTGEETNIPNSTYSGWNTDPEVITVTNPAPGNYVLKAYGCYTTGWANATVTYVLEEQDEIKFSGTVIEKSPPLIGGAWWNVTVDEVISGPKPCSNELTVYWGAYPPMGYFDPNITVGDTVEVYGNYSEDQNGCSVSLNGKNDYYIISASRVHNIDTGENFSSIQEAIDDHGTKNGHTITVDSGNYTENVEVTKSLTIRSSSGNPEDTIVQAAVSNHSFEDNVFTVTADNVNVKGFTIKGASYFWCSGITLIGNNSIISNNTFEDNAIGIWTYGSDNTIRNNNFSSSSGYSPSIALYIESAGNKIYLNNFMIDPGEGGGPYFPTFWNSTEKITYTYNSSTFTNYLGNYWDDYKDVDANNDGIWDTPYSIDGDKDNYPLKEPWENYIPVGGKPDLIIENISWSQNSPEQGDTITFTVKIKNQGSGDAGGFYVYYYLDGSHVDYDYAYVLALSAGSISIQSFTWTADKCGDIQVKAVADINNAVDESNEENNEGIKTVSVSCPEKPDLTITDISFSKTNPVEGEPMTITVKVKNIGEVTARKFFVNLSEKTKYIVDDPSSSHIHIYLIGSKKINELKPGEEINVGMHWNAIRILNNEAFDAVNNGKILGWVDNDQSIDEMDEDNNWLFKNIDVQSTLPFIPSGEHGYHFVNDKTLSEKEQDLLRDYYEEIIKLPSPWNHLTWLAISHLVTFATRGNCEGMSTTSAIYYNHPDLRPPEYLYTLTFYMPKSDPVIDKIMKYQTFQVVKCIIAWMNNDPLEFDQGSQYDFIKENVNVDKPVLIYLGETNYTTGKIDWLHVVLGFGMYDKARNVVIYDPNYPGVDRVIHFLSNGIDYEDYDYAFPFKYEVVPELETVANAIIEFLKDHLSELMEKNLNLMIFECPVNTTITDQYGRIIADNGTNEIPDASMLITNETKIFYLPAGLTYSTDIDAYDTGTFNFTRVSPIGKDISITKFENISVTAITKAFVEIEPNVTNYTMSIDYDGDGEIDEERYPDVNETIIVSPAENIFDTKAPANPYPSIAGTYTGKITPNQPIGVQKLYTYPCAGTGGHTEFVRIYGNGINKTASWEGYREDWHNITFDSPFSLEANKTYNFTIITGSYPQIHHTPTLPTENGWINCTEFTDVNGRVYYDWIPAIRLE